MRSSSAFAANVPAALHGAISAGGRDRVPQAGRLSGFGPAEAPAVADAYREGGLEALERVDAHDCTVILVGRT